MGNNIWLCSVIPAVQLALYLQ